MKSLSLTIARIPRRYLGLALSVLMTVAVGVGCGQPKPATISLPGGLTASQSVASSNGTNQASVGTLAYDCGCFRSQLGVSPNASAIIRAESTAIIDKPASVGAMPDDVGLLVMWRNISQDVNTEERVVQLWCAKRGYAFANCK